MVYLVPGTWVRHVDILELVSSILLIFNYFYNSASIFYYCYKLYALLLCMCISLIYKCLLQGRIKQ